MIDVGRCIRILSPLLSVLSGSECERSDKIRKRFSIKFLAHLIPPPDAGMCSNTFLSHRRRNYIGPPLRILCVEGRTRAVMGTACIIGFDSAWTGKKGAICALLLGAGDEVDFSRPVLADFDEALTYVQVRTELHDFCLVAVDQPTLVPNQTGCRPVDRVAASLVSYIGGGVQPANRNKALLFGDAAPFWSFKKSLCARECPEESRSSDSGLFLIEVFPALALPALNSAFCGRLKGPKYNPANKRFRLQDWQSVIQTVRRYARTARLDAVEGGRERSN
jgi:predicted RNase H-like nuclease